MIAFGHKAAAFVKRDFRIDSGYKASFFMRILESLMLLTVFHFLSGLIQPQSSASLGSYGGRFFPFALVGLAFARYFDLMLRMFSESIRTAQTTGCLEAMLSSQTGCMTVVLMSSLYGLISGAVQLVLMFAGGVMAFGLDLSRMNVPATLVVLAVSIAIFLGFGVLSAAAVVWLKKGDPVTWLLGTVGAILGGAYFPTDVMPVWLQKLSLLVPITYSLDALRATILNGSSLAMIGQLLFTLSGIALVLLPLSAIVFAAAVRNGRREGTLMQY